MQLLVSYGGYVALHHDVTKVSHLASSMAISLIPRLTVLVGAIFFIGLALIIIMVPITWDGVLDALTKKIDKASYFLYF